MIDQYILEGHTPVKCADLLTLIRWCQTHDRRVAHSEKDGVRISTVFLGIDHGGCSDRPLLFETMVFGGEHEGDLKRYSTWDEAVEGHKNFCKEYHLPMLSLVNG